MRFLACFFLLSAALLNAALPSKSTAVTVLVDFENPHSDVSLPALQGELQHLLQPLGLNVNLQDKSLLPPKSEFGDLVVFKMKGSCSMRPLPIGALSDERGPLAMAYSSDGTVLHFGEVECDRIRQCLSRILGRGSSKKNESYLSTALGLIMAHEMYHMIANSKVHTRSGVTKQSLSAEDLLNADLALPQLAREAVRRQMVNSK